MDSADEIVMKKLDAFLMKKKLIKLQALCAKGRLGEHGSKRVLADRIITASKNLSVDFAAIDYAELTYFQILGKCIVEGLPTEGKRSVLKKH
eukprot:1637132-Rhodomonas_salina.1